MELLNDKIQKGSMFHHDVYEVLIGYSGGALAHLLSG